MCRWLRVHLSNETVLEALDPSNDDTSMNDVEAQAIHALYPSITCSHDQAHREERLLAILETIAAMDEPKKSEMIGYAIGVLDGMAAKRRAA